MNRAPIAIVLAFLLTSCAPSCSVPIDVELPQSSFGGDPRAADRNCSEDLKQVYDYVLARKSAGDTQAEAVLGLHEQRRLSDLDTRVINGLYTASPGTPPEEVLAEVSAECARSERSTPTG